MLNFVEIYNNVVSYLADLFKSALNALTQP